MNVSSNTVWLSIYRVFEDRLIRPGSRLCLKELMVAWAKTRMDEIELASGLESLARMGYLRLEASTDGPAVRLLDDSFGIPRPRMNEHQVLTWMERLRQVRQFGAEYADGPFRVGSADDFAKAV